MMREGDFLEGQDGNHKIKGGWGNDGLTGSSGNDTEKGAYVDFWHEAEMRKGN